MLELESQNERVNYLINGLKQDLFPCNYKNNGERWSWGIAISIPSNDTIPVNSFSFNKTLQKEIGKAIKFSQALKGDYGDSGPPQLILNYIKDKFVLIIECYDREANTFAKHLNLSEALTIMYIETMFKEGKQFYDLSCKTATYEY